MGIYINPNGTSAEVGPGLGVIRVVARPSAGFGGYPANCGPDEYEVEAYQNYCEPMSREELAARDAAAARERTRQQQAEMEQRRRQRQAEQQQYQREQQQRRAIAAVTRATRAPLGVRPPARGR